MNKTELVLEHLKKNGTITSWEAIEKYGATRLSAIIFTLRKREYNIISHNEFALDRFGNKTHYAKYELVKE